MSNNENSSLSMEKYNLVAFYNFLAHLFKTKAMIDAGVLKFFCNAIWGGWTRYMYLCPRPLMNAISNAVAGGKEDAPSAVMQKWGYDNYKP